MFVLKLSGIQRYISLMITLFIVQSANIIWVQTKMCINFCTLKLYIFSNIAVFYFSSFAIIFSIAVQKMEQSNIPFSLCRLTLVQHTIAQSSLTKRTTYFKLKKLRYLCICCFMWLANSICFYDRNTNLKMIRVWIL